MAAILFTGCRIKDEKSALKDDWKKTYGNEVFRPEWIDRDRPLGCVALKQFVVSNPIIHPDGSVKVNLTILVEMLLTPTMDRERSLALTMAGRSIPYEESTGGEIIGRGSKKVYAVFSLGDQLPDEVDVVKIRLGKNEDILFGLEDLTKIRSSLKELKNRKRKTGFAYVTSSKLEAFTP